MRILYVPEKNDLVCVTLAGGRYKYGRVQNVDEDGACYCMSNEGDVDWISINMTWSVVDHCWYVKGKDITV